METRRRGFFGFLGALALGGGAAKAQAPRGAAWPSLPGPERAEFAAGSAEEFYRILRDRFPETYDLLLKVHGFPCPKPLISSDTLDISHILTDHATGKDVAIKRTVRVRATGSFTLTGDPRKDLHGQD